MAQTYKYETEFRNIWSIGGTAFTVVFFTIAQIYGAPNAFLAFAGFIMAVMVYQILRNPRSGIEVRSHYIRAYCGGWERRVSVPDIAHVELYRNSDGGDSLIVHDRMGKKTPIPGQCYGKLNDMLPTLEALGLRVEERSRGTS